MIIIKKEIIIILSLVLVLSGCTIQKDIVKPLQPTPKDVCEKIEGKIFIDGECLEESQLTIKQLCEQQGKVYFGEMGGKCVYKELVKNCEDSGGTYTWFSNGCADNCGKKPRICTQAMTMGCDCGETKCWGHEVCPPPLLCVDPAPKCIDDPYEPYATPKEACEETNGMWMSPEQIPFPITNEVLCKDNDGKWVDISKIEIYYIDLGITTQKECDKYRSKCFGIGTHPISVTQIGICEGDLLCLHGDFYEDTCLLSLDKEVEIKKGNIPKCICPEGKTFTLQGCSIPSNTLASIIAYR